MTYNQQTGHAGYTGDAQLWQGATSIRAKTITLDEATGNLTAKDTRALGDARRDQDHAKPEATAADKAARDGERPRRRPPPRHRREPRARAPRRPRRQHPRRAAPPAKGKPRVVASDTIATANELVYDDAERRARYTGTARMVGERGDLRGDRIELYFDESGHGVSRLEGFDNVRFSLKARPGGEPAVGQRRPPDLLRRRRALRAERPARGRGRTARTRSSAARPGPHA